MWKLGEGTLVEWYRHMVSVQLGDVLHCDSHLITVLFLNE